MLKYFWRKWVHESPIRAGENVICALGGETVKVCVGVVVRVDHEGTGEVCVMSPPNAPHYYRLHLKRYRDLNGVEVNTAWRP